MYRKGSCYVSIAVAAVVAVAWLTVSRAAADTFDERVYFTFSGPVELPGVALAPGKYIFRLGNPDTGRDVIQVLSADGTKPYGNFFTWRVERPTPASQPEVRFMENAPGAPPAIKTIWYPGQRTGREFIYPKDTARRLAKDAKEPVLTTQAQTTTTEQTKTSDLSRVASSGQETRVAASDKPAAAAPAGTAQQGEEVPTSIEITVAFVK
jgi:hypothetical protein